MGGLKKEKKVKVINPSDYDDYGDFIAAKKAAEAPKEEKAE